MQRWKELPSGLPERQRRLLVQLRRMKDHSGLGLAALAAKTDYSRSSWERYLNGKKPVPRGAVEQLARVCGADPTRLLVLHEVAAEAPEAPEEPAQPERPAEPDTASTASDAATAEPESEPESEPLPSEPSDSLPKSEPMSPSGTLTKSEPLPGSPPEPESEAARNPLPTKARSAGRRVVPARYAFAGVVAVAVVAFAAGLLVAGYGDPATEEPSPQTYGPGRTYECEDGRKDGEAYAGHSLTDDALIDINGSGRDVVEAQCLLSRHGVDPGNVDGLYGQRTKAAVREFQESRQLVDDGIVGPDTWAELRR